MSPPLERYPSLVKEANAALQINRTLGQRSDTENNGDDPHYLPTHTCSYCQRVFESLWLDNRDNILNSPMNASLLYIKFGNSRDVGEAVRKGCEFYERLQEDAAGDKVAGGMYPGSDGVLLRIFMENTPKEFECYALNRYALNIGSPFYPKEVLPNLNPLSASTVNFMRSVLKERLCLVLQPTGRIPPKRLLKLDASQHTVQLIETTASSIYSYATLSYCWGGDQEIMTKRVTVKSHKRGILVDTLPRTIRDAVQVATVLGLQYLWVDVLCIIQDDKEDVACEIAHQADVYRGSTFTILAGDCASTSDGFLHTRPLPVERFRISVRTPGTSDAGSWLIMGVDKPRRHNPIEKRGWILQEFLLSPYVLYFSPCQLMIYCHDRMYVNGGHKEYALATTPLRRNWHSGKINAGSAAENWGSLVDCYSAMSVSKSSDKLAAISAAAEELGGRFLEPHEMHTSYKAGLWLQHMPKNLLWHLTSLPCLPRPPYRAPSWSWASIDSPVTQFERLADKTCTDLIRVVSCTTKPTFSSAQFGEVMHGTLRLLGPLKTMFSYEIDEWSITVCDIDHSLRALCYLDALEPELGKKSVDSDAKISVLLCASGKMSDHNYEGWIYLHGLLLTRKSSETAFRRIGHWYYEYNNEEEMKWFASFETAEVTII